MLVYGMVSALYTRMQTVQQRNERFNDERNQVYLSFGTRARSHIDQLNITKIEIMAE